MTHSWPEITNDFIIILKARNTTIDVTQVVHHYELLVKMIFSAFRKDGPVHPLLKELIKESVVLLSFVFGKSGCHFQVTSLRNLPKWRIKIQTVKSGNQIDARKSDLLKLNRKWTKTDEDKDKEIVEKYKHYNNKERKSLTSQQEPQLSKYYTRP